MRALFWRKRNDRLAARLNSVIETSERVRKSFRPPPPRVTIDTSFLESSTEAEKVPERFEAELSTGADAGLELEHAAEAQCDVATQQRELAARLEDEALREQAARYEAEAHRDEVV